ncbi:MAG: hypothetical protein JW929_08195 [Anaerolineales bacterium]|nr:hypothetical protein [Anaerolineales bacterium]
MEQGKFWFADRIYFLASIILLAGTMLYGLLVMGVGGYAGYLHEQGRPLFETTSQHLGIVDYLCGSMLLCCGSAPFGAAFSLLFLGVGTLAKKARLIEEGRLEINKFTNIWYLPEENTWRKFQPLAYQDVGTLELHKDGVDFFGGKEKVLLRNIKTVGYGKQGRDFVLNWVQIEYGDGRKAFLADGNFLGWKGFYGGTKLLYHAIRKKFQ